VERDESTIRILNALTTFNIENFNDRLRLQKLVFLARKMGFNAGYSFDWYLRGPYSPSLTRMLFSANDQDQLIVDDYTLNVAERAVVERLTEFLHDDVESHRVLELLASVWYYIRRRVYSEDERQELLDEINQKKPQYSRTEIERAFDRIMRYLEG